MRPPKATCAGFAVCLLIIGNNSPRLEEVWIGEPFDIARFHTIRHDRPPKSHDVRTIICDSSAKTHDLRPNLNDRARECLMVVYAAEIVRNRGAIG